MFERILSKKVRIAISEHWTILFGTTIQRYDQNDVPIIDEPLLSPKRIYYSILRWLWWTIQGKDHSFLEFLFYSRRPFAQYKKGLY